MKVPRGACRTPAGAGRGRRWGACQGRLPRWSWRHSPHQGPCPGRLRVCSARSSHRSHVTASAHTCPTRSRAQALPGPAPSPPPHTHTQLLHTGHSPACGSLQPFPTGCPCAQSTAADLLGGPFPPPHLCPIPENGTSSRPIPAPALRFPEALPAFSVFLKHFLPSGPPLGDLAFRPLKGKLCSIC